MRRPWQFQVFHYYRVDRWDTIGTYSSLEKLEHTWSYDSYPGCKLRIVHRPTGFVYDFLPITDICEVPL